MIRNTWYIIFWQLRIAAQKMLSIFIIIYCYHVMKRVWRNSLATTDLVLSVYSPSPIFSIFMKLSIVRSRENTSFNNSRRDYTKSFPRCDQEDPAFVSHTPHQSPYRHLPNEQIQIKRHAILVNTLRTLAPSDCWIRHSCRTSCILLPCGCFPFTSAIPIYLYLYKYKYYLYIYIYILYLFFSQIFNKIGNLTK